MKFVVEFRLNAGSKNKVLEIFESKGPNRVPGVHFRHAWIGTKSNVVFVVAESDSEAQINAAAETWKEHGSYQIHPVIDIEQL